MGVSEGELSDANYEGYYAERDRDKASRGVRNNNNAAGAATRGQSQSTVDRKGKKAPAGQRSGSLVSTAASRGVSRPRTVVSRYVSSEDDDADPETRDEDERERERIDRGRQRAMSPGLPLLHPARGGEDDDEVERRDRGEELVRKRMKDRARIKKVSNPVQLGSLD